MTYIPKDKVPATNESANVTLGEVIGSKVDTTAGTSIVAISKQIKAKTDTIPTSPLGIADLDVPSLNSAANTTSRDVIGNKTDDEGGNSLAAKAFIQTMHIHSVGKVYPTLANGTAIAAGTGVWTLGTKVEIVPANTIVDPFDIHHILVEVASGDDTFCLALYQGASDVEIGRVRFTRDSTGGLTVMSAVPFMTPIIPGNARIRAAIATQSGTAGRSATVSLFYHTY